MRIPVVIPAYEPDGKLLDLCRSLVESGIGDIVVVDDGSGKEYQPVFQAVQEECCGVVLRHAANMGKGRALKDAFNFLLNEREDLVGCVTADSDGQHTVKDILKCMEALEQDYNCFILGCRDFDQPDVPFKSRFGNKLTQKVCKGLCGIAVSDTQTGLRAIPKEFMEYLLNTSGERFEFETNMLVESRGRFGIVEVMIETVYDSKTEHKTHFDPVRDSIRIYKIFGGIFFKFLVSSFSSSFLDILLFLLFCPLLQAAAPLWYAAAATALARAVSAFYNYLVNYKVVFRSSEKHSRSAIKYFTLAAVQMCVSALLVTAGIYIFYMLEEVTVKIVVDIVLFFISYWIQNSYIFRAKG